MSNIISKADMFKITGCKCNDPEGQKRSLKANGIPFSVNCKGEPLLTWTVYNQALLTRRTSTPAANGDKLPAGFNLAAAS
ncbi:DUF4224 domain-containing protein [Microbulbifer agarilyticus]|nr:DUF4224 domain-containing protein [Microbulbifer agarilyticus]